MTLHAPANITSVAQAFHSLWADMRHEVSSVSGQIGILPTGYCASANAPAGAHLQEAVSGLRSSNDRL